MQTFIMIPADDSKPLTEYSISDVTHQALNAAIGAEWGTIAQCLEIAGIPRLGMWVDDEALMQEQPQVNVRATQLHNKEMTLYGNALLIFQGRDGETLGVPHAVHCALGTRRKMTIEIDQSEYHAGAEPNPYDGTYSEE